jgi:glycosyltransferase involved in cell wall biosynthesis
MNNRKQINNVKFSDLVFVSSIEQKEFAIQFNDNIEVHHWYRYLEETKTNLPKKNTEGSRIQIVYHGNKIHLESISTTLKPALEKLSEFHDLEFLAIYNIKKLGIWTKSVPRNVKINHIQWDENTYIEYINNADIGVIPNFIPQSSSKISFYLSKLYMQIRFRSSMNINKNDYKLRFKHNSNPGRLYEFAVTKKPVVAEATLSIAQQIEHGFSGYLVLSYFGWYEALNKLILNEKLRLQIGQNLFDRFEERLKPQDLLEIFELNLKKLIN